MGNASSHEQRKLSETTTESSVYTETSTSTVAGGKRKSAAIRRLSRRLSPTASSAAAAAESPQRVQEQDAPDLDKFSAPTVVAEQAEIDREQRACFAAFETWLSENGAEFPGLQLQCYTENVRGVYAERDVPAKTQIMRIPLTCLITDELARRTPLGRKVHAARFSLVVPKHCLVIVFILTTMSAARDRVGPRGCSKTSTDKQDGAEEEEEEEEEEDASADASASADVSAKAPHSPAPSPMTGEAAEAKATGSFFQPYYDVLPKDLSNFPVYWTEEEMALLRGSALHREVAQRRANIKKDFEVLSRRIPALRSYSCWTYDDFLWCRTMVASRNFSITVNGEPRTAMVPQADMLNHFRPRETSWTYNQTLGAFTMTSLATLTGGRQIMDSYGKKCNSRFLLHYGFAVERNVEADGSCPDQLELQLCASDFSDLAAEKASSRNEEIDSRVIDDASLSGAATKSVAVGGEVAGRVRAARTLIEFKLQSLASTKRVRITRAADAADTAAAMAFLRVACATRAELGRARAVGAGVGGHGCAVVSAANEAAALRGLAQACRVHLAAQPRTLAEDMALLEGGRSADGALLVAPLPPFSNARNAVLVTSGEKQICQFYIDLAEAALAVIHLAPAARREAIGTRWGIAGW
tara:strand:- start:318 stop:2240 length:1923 start_codon:yes stop_codon:yes gene_type:complete